MDVIAVRNVHDALPEGLLCLRHKGSPRSSRNGPVLVAQGPVSTVYAQPNERVMFWPVRDANPFFHLLEALWMLAGRMDVAYPAALVKRMREFSDGGTTLHGAYGARWRAWFGFDQIRTIADRLRRDPDDRRSVLTMWDPAQDLDRNGKDIPCNTHAYVSVNNEGHLDMTVCCRSNDIIWGAYGSNAVHFSMLQELFAAWVERPVGRLTQVSNNYHAYIEQYQKISNLCDEVRDPVYRMERNPYSLGSLKPFPLVARDPEEWLEQCEGFVSGGMPTEDSEPFFYRVAEPMRRAYLAHKRHDTDEAIEILNTDCAATDWRRAGVEWLSRRLVAKPTLTT